MKKIFALLAVAFGVMSCQTDVNDFGANVGGEQDVNILVSLPEATRANSAVGAFGNVDFDKYDIKYFFQVFDATNDDNCKAIQTKVCDDKEVAFPVRLIAGRDYRFVVWAHLVDAQGHAHYTVGETLKEISLNEDCWVAMDDTRDAYTGVKTATFTGSSDIAIELTRPFAKLRVVTTDMEELLGVEPVSAVVTYTNDTEFYTSFNALTETPADKTLTKGHDYEIKSYGETGAKKTLFADYFFAKDGDFVKFNIAVAMNDGGDAIERSFTTNIPVKRNTLTTIEGNILTEGDDITVTIDDVFEQPGHNIDIWDGETVTTPEIKTDAVTGQPVAVIDSASDLAGFAALINGAAISTLATRAGEVVNFVLETNIDLNNMPWTPIGTQANPYTGMFDGKGHTIYNLNVDGGSNSNKGFFGYTINGEVKNLTIENAKVSGRLNVGVVAGTPYTTKYTNIAVKGHVEVNGMAYVGGVGGKNAYANWENITVDVDDTSYVNANSIENGTAYRTYVGGVVGFNGEGGHSFKNITSNINVKGSTCDVGGLFGIAHYSNKFENCVCYGDVEIYAAEETEEAQEIGGIAGVWHNETGCSVTMTDCSFTGTLKTNIEGVEFYYGGLVGKPYGDGEGKLFIDGFEMVNNGVALKDGVYSVSNAAGLKWVAKQVNSGANYFEGKTIVLAADIDLNGEEWTPIGSAYMDHGFMGNFDGKGFAIKNLAIKNIALDSDGYAYAGLFGVTEGVDQDNQNYIKNLVIENVNIDTNGHIVAAAIAYPYYTNLENIKVQGNVSIEGGDYTSGVLAYTRRCVDAKDIAIAANEGSYIKGNKTIGGVISDIQMNGGLTANYSNFAASGLTIEGVMHVGGISGIISRQTLNGATVKNVNIVCDDARKGIVSGSLGDKSTIENVAYENVTGATRVIGATYDAGHYVGQIVDVNGVKAVVYSIANGVKAVSVEELNLKGKSAKDAAAWAEGLGEGWSLASIYDLDAIHVARFALNEALAADNAENALFCETEYYVDGKYAMYVSSTEAVGNDPQGEAYFANRVHLKYFNLNGYWDYNYSTFATINANAPLKDNYFARGVYAL